MISFNRLELLKVTVASYLETITMPFDLLIVDNGSSDETREWLEKSKLNVLFLGENRYPGHAANQGWLQSTGEHMFLHRSDNDLRYLPGWSDAVMERFRRGHGRGHQGETNLQVGQVGLMTDHQEGRAVTAVGGNMVLRREVYEAGVRYTDEPWSTVPWEDGLMTGSVVAAGWGFSRVATQCLVHLGDPPDFNDPYYVDTYRTRGILPKGIE